VGESNDLENKLMAEGNDDQRDQNQVTHPSRREVIRLLGGSALLGPFFVSGCFSRDPLSPDHDANPQLLLDAQAATGVSPQPLILFVPGYTGNLGLGINNMKAKYYKSQKAFLKGREWVDMNEVPATKTLYADTDNEVTLTFNRSGARLFDSHNGAIKCNADAIEALLGVCLRSGVRVTIVSHSKGGQDVLHALVKLNNEEDLPYSGGSQGPGRPLNRDLWEQLAGWLAFTSNWFESDFPVVGKNKGGCDQGAGLPNTCIGGERCNVPPNPCPPDNTPSIYQMYVSSGYTLKNPGKDSREQYMWDHKRTIKNMLACVPTVSAWGSFVPGKEGPIDNASKVAATNRGIRNDGKGANDGLVPTRAGRLHQAMLITQLVDDDNKPNKCGVDHLAPVLDVTNRNRRFWTPKWRNQETERYLGIVETAELCGPSEPPPEPPPEEPSNAERIEQLIGEVEQLYNDGSLSAGEANSLTSKCDGAMAALDKGNTRAASNKLGSFINEVNAMVKSGRLGADEGRTLMDAAQAAIDAINGA
jgi:hypothetical protein